MLDIEGYFELNLVQTSYNYGQNGIKYSNTPIETHQCNDEDQAKFSVDKDNIEEYFRIPSAQQEFRTMQCIDDPSKHHVSGVVSGAFGSGIMLTLSKCKGDHCKTDDIFENRSIGIRYVTN